MCFMAYEGAVGRCDESMGTTHALPPLSAYTLVITPKLLSLKFPSLNPPTPEP